MGGVKLGALGAPLVIKALDIGDPKVHENGHRVGAVVRHDVDARLVWRRTSAWVHDQPRVRELDHARILLENHLTAQHPRVEVTRPRHVTDGQKQRDEKSLRRRRQVLEIDRGTFGHLDFLLEGPRSSVH